MKKIELIEKRKLREKHFLQEDGTILAEVYDTDIHYLKNGKYEEIDNTLIKDKVRNNERVSQNNTNETNNKNIQDTYIYPGDSNSVKSDKAYLKAGVEKIDGVLRPNRTLINFSLPTIGTGSEVVYATLNLTSYPTYTLNPTPRFATIHRVTADWDEESANWDNMNDKYDERVESIFYGSRSEIIEETIRPAGSYYDGNITNLVKKWYRGTPRFGVMLKAIDESEYIDDDYPIFYSNDNSFSDDNNPRPVLSVVYRNHNGLENYLDYQTQIFTDGTAYVNTYNGNLTTLFRLGHTVGGNLPVNLELIYNTNDVVLENETFFKKGYKLNLEQTIKEIDGNLEYLDEDGTIHYFNNNGDSNIYSDNDGLNLTIEKTDSICTMNDINGNKMIFTNIDNVYRLTKIIDVDENYIDITLNNDNSINKITDKYGYEVSITYSESNIVVTSPDMTTTLNYSNNLLSCIETINGITMFDYTESGTISTITDVAGLKINYEYYPNSPYRVSKVTQIGLNNTIGEYFTLDYGFETTNIVDSKGKTKTLIYNSYGNLLSENSLSSGEDIDNAYSINRTYGNNEYAKNRILTSEIPIRYIKNYLKNTSFESDVDCFQSDSEYVIKSYSTDEYFSGNRSLKVETLHAGQSIEQNIQLPKGKYYTFSGYFKSSDSISISLSYIDKDGIVVIEEQNINSNNEFEREDVTIFYDEEATSNLYIKINFPSIGTTYIDDVQLEDGEVANSFNIIENSDFSEGYSEWELDGVLYGYKDIDVQDSTFNNGKNTALDVNVNPTYGDKKINVQDSFSVATFNNGKNTALKVSVNPTYGVKFTKTIPVKGKKGDLYTISFWYKNLGIPGFGQFAGSCVSIYFKPVGRDAQYCIATSDYFNPNEDKWQFFTYRSHAPEDFECVKLTFLFGHEANDFYLTNLSLFKDVTSGEYQYDGKGNLVSITDQSGNKNVFQYDSNNQLINSTDALGKNFKYEYDNNKKSRVLSAISSNGISNRVIYDNNGNPIRTIISKKYSNEINDGLYKIRNKGTNKYLKAELNVVLLEENDCSNTLWKLEKNGDKYKILYSINPEYSISIRNGIVALDAEDTNNLFILEKNNDSLNGTYHIKYEEEVPNGVIVKFLTVDETVVKTNTFSDLSSNIEFYIELEEELFIENKAEYTEDGRFVQKKVDSALNEQIYNSNIINGLINSVVDKNNNVLKYTHNTKKQLIQIQLGSKIINYEYNDLGLVSKIKQDNKEYCLFYDNFLNIENVKLNNNISFINNIYENGSKLLKTIYGNNNFLSFEYDQFDRISKIIKMDNIGSYKYDNNGNIVKINSDYNNYKYYYDSANRLYKYIDNKLIVEFSYDSDNFITKKKYKIKNRNNDIEHTLNINYLNELPISVNVDSDIVSYSYDNLDRVKSKNIKNLYNIYYKYKSYGKRTTNIIEEYSIDNDKYKYKYDKYGNIIEIYHNSDLINSYEYDLYSELIKDTNHELNIYTEYNYNLYGNIVKRVTKQLDTNVILNEHDYMYENQDWEDQLTCFDNENIEYDSIGNPIKIGNNTLSWINGKELNKYVNTSKNQTIEYKYNIDGIRISKTINGVETRYFIDGQNIMFEETKKNTIYYLYDLDGIIGLNYNNSIYYFIKNYQKDVIGIINSNGEKIVSYCYDSWGNLLSIKDNEGNEIVDENNIGVINPFRYRGYYYDKETNLYYLGSRYYNPKWGRFISTDSFIGSNQDVFSNNLYLYVSNNPINNIDCSGNIMISFSLGNAVAGLFKQSKKKNNKKKDQKVKEQNKSKSKYIPKVTTSSTQDGKLNILNKMLRTVLIDYSLQTGKTNTSVVYDSDSPVGIDFNLSPFDPGVSIQVSTPVGNISQSYNLFSSSTRFEGNWKNSCDNKKTRFAFETGCDALSCYAQGGNDTLTDNGYVFSYNRFTVSKLVVVIAVVAPELLKSIGEYVTFKTPIEIFGNI